MNPLPYDLTGKRVWVAGHRGMVGAALVRRLAREDCDVVGVGREDLDLTDQRAVLGWMHNARPQAVFFAAAKVGGFHPNDARPVDALRDNLMIATAILTGAEDAGVEKLLLIGSASVYPADAAQPIGEDALLSGALDPVNQWYGVAKLAAIKLAQAYRRQYGCDFISAMPTNLYGPGDDFDLTTAPVMPALIRKVHEASSGGGPVELWGSGTPLREFLHVDDCADACVHLMQHYSDESPINIGSGEEIAVADLARLIMAIAGHEAEIVTQPDRPDGAARELLDSARLNALGWRARIGLRDGIAQTLQAYRDTL